MECVTGAPTPLETGLTAAQAQARLQAGLSNAQDVKPGKTVARILRENLLTLFNLLNLALAAAVLLVGSPRNALFMGVVFSNAFIGTFQALRAKRTLDRLKLVVAPTARALRDGRVERIAQEQVVLGDLLLFDTGDQIPVDAAVRDGAVEVDESLLTGESLPVKKLPEDKLLSGSFVVAGKCVAQAERVGGQTYAAALTRQARKPAPPRSELMRSLRALIRALSFAIVPLGLILFSRQFFFGGASLRDSVVSTVAAMIGMIPEGLMLLTSVALAVGVVRLSRRHTLVQSLYSMEDLARVDVLCLDKTGTLTSGKLAFECLEPLPARSARAPGAPGEDSPPPAPLPGEVPAPLGENCFAPEPLYDEADCARARFAGGAARADENSAPLGENGFAPDSFYGEADCARALGALLGAVGGSDATSKALASHFPADPLARIGRVVPFSSARKWSGAQVDDQAVVLGAAQFVLPKADSFLIEKIAAHTKCAKRVLLLARSDAPFSQDSLPEGLAPLALVVLSDEIRPEAPETLRFFAREGVAIKVISGDDPLSASAVAARAGVGDSDRFVDASTLPDEAALRDAAGRYTVFGRVTPDQKRALVRALKDRGHTVAMTGDGVNDIPALKEADCSIAMASGSDAARKVASLVLLDCNFASMPEVVMEGRRVIGNLRRSAALFLTKTVFSFLLSVLSMFSGAAYPFVPIQLTLFSSAAVGIPSFFLALEPNRARVEGRFMPYVLSRALPGGVTIALGAWALSALGGARGLSGAQTGTLATIFLLSMGMAVLACACWPPSFKRTVILLLSLAMIVTALVGFPAFFELTALPAASLKLLAAVLSAALPCFFGMNLLFSRIFRRNMDKKTLHP
jgi:cation-transporting ATPase E